MDITFGIEKLSVLNAREAATIICAISEKGKTQIVIVDVRKNIGDKMENAIVEWTATFREIEKRIYTTKCYHAIDWGCMNLETNYKIG